MVETLFFDTKNRNIKLDTLVIMLTRMALASSCQTGSYPTKEEEIADYNDWVTIDWERLPLIFNGLPRRLF